jgi:RNA polymerase sigma-70 factor (ECF subfamily)
LTELLLSGAEPEPALESWADGRVPILRDCVEKLAPKSRKLVAGRYSDGWKAPDLADHLGMTPVAVRKALMRIREQLKQCVELQMGEFSS